MRPTVLLGLLVVAGAAACATSRNPAPPDGDAADVARDEASSGDEASVAPDAADDGAEGARDAREDAGAEDAPPVVRIPPECLRAAERGMEWLASHQNEDASWGGPDYRVGPTAFAVLKFETYALEQGKDPFDPAYEYRAQVATGLDYLFSKARTVALGPQPAGNPDTNGNGSGVFFVCDTEFMYENLPLYDTAIALMAIAGGSDPDRVVATPGSPVSGRTHKDVAQDIVDYLAWSQTDDLPSPWFPAPRGGWTYTPMVGSGDRSDNSITGWVTLALEYAEHPDYRFACVFPRFLRAELDFWVTSIQNPTDGGSGYTAGSESGNMYRTGALLQQMSFLGDRPEPPLPSRLERALGFVAAQWNPYFHATGPAGETWYYSAAYSVMKGLDSLGLDTVGGIDWYRDLCGLLVAQQNPDGSWSGATSDLVVLNTEWATLTLERAAPPPPLL